MTARKRAATANGDAGEPVVKRRSTRQAAAAAAAASTVPSPQVEESVQSTGTRSKKTIRAKAEPKPKATPRKRKAEPKTEATPRASKPTKKVSKDGGDAGSDGNDGSSRAPSPDLDPESIPRINPDAVRHEGQWYWLMKAEPESRFENGIDVRFSIDDLRACTEPEGWDGIRAYAARNNLRAMNAGDMAFFYHSNCKTPGIVGTMEIVREYSEDKSARRPGTPYYDPSSTRDNPRWSLVHVEFRRKFAVPIYLPELRELGKSGGPLEQMQMLRQSRLSVSRVSADEWKALCQLADEKAKAAGLEHEDG
ncbi:Thymocyte nuclear protein-like protein [Hapsidospora chrysogenum ATCC 11550]|uniref:Thymocyte nuclear protein 1 n=1 Tax=Hapsidospora chrysogenum (strain ATCC 11550 / CBS 779.69 / DSM 880 / IAM 14645 / JCM 23072 / IMI 49137) TaxID=857340 RepID=A0A086SWU9_HAPC1|nr:Thymocyte nuclear protein-like protein [Hapsidospora chrysogenum ATCC 11550]